MPAALLSARWNKPGEALCAADLPRRAVQDVATEGLLVLAKTAAFAARFNKLLREGSEACSSKEQQRSPSGVEKSYRVLRWEAQLAGGGEGAPWLLCVRFVGGGYAGVAERGARGRRRRRRRRSCEAVPVGLMQHTQVDERCRQPAASDAVPQPRRVTMRRLGDDKCDGGGGALCLLEVLRCEEVRFTFRAHPFAVRLPVCHS